MLTLARNNLFKDKVRLAISIGGVAFAVALIVLLRGLYLAYETKVSDFYNGMHADAWVLQEGSADLLFSYSALPLRMEDRLARIYGVEKVIPYAARQMSFRVRGEKVQLKIVAFNPHREGPGPGPLAMLAGDRTITDDQIIIDRVFARQNDVGIGDHLDINDQRLQVAGISDGGDMVAFQYAFVTRPRSRDLFESKKLVTGFLLVYDEGAPIGFIRDQVQAGGNAVMVRSSAEMIKANRRVINAGFLPVLGVLLVIGFLIGVAVIGLTIYSAVLERRREYGILKAVGGRTAQMLLLVAVQALFAAIAGYAVGIAVSLLAARGAEQWVPQFITRIQPRDLALVGVAALFMGLIAAFVPLRKIAQVDPAVVFRA